MSKSGNSMVEVSNDSTDKDMPNEAENMEDMATSVTSNNINLAIDNVWTEFVMESERFPDFQSQATCLYQMESKTILMFDPGIKIGVGDDCSATSNQIQRQPIENEVWVILVDHFWASQNRDIGGKDQYRYFSSMAYQREGDFLHLCFSRFLSRWKTKIPLMESCDGVESHWPTDGLLVKYQWVLIQFGVFIIACGATHLINFWTFTLHSKTIAVVMTIAEVSTADVSRVTTLIMVPIISDLLSVKIGETFLKHKAEELDREVGIIIKQEETSKHVHMLTDKIRSTLDRHLILKTTLVELWRTLDLEERALWMPSQRGLHLQLSYTLSNLITIVSFVPTSLPVLNEVFSRSEAIHILHTCSLANTGRFLTPKGIRKWREHELEHVEVVDQVAVAPSHAAILEASLQSYDQLMQRNIVLDLTRQEAELAICARNDFLSLYSMLLKSELFPDRVMIETILKSSNILAMLINNALDLSRLKDGNLHLEAEKSNLQRAFGEVVDLIRPIASVKKLSLYLILAPDVPVYATGNEK